MNRISNFLSVKPGEGRMTALVIAMMLFVEFGAALGATGIDALFLNHYGAAKLQSILPIMYIALGISVMVTSFGITSLLGRIRQELLYLALPPLFVLLIIGARLALNSPAEWLYPTLWLGKEIAITLSPLVIWGVAGMVSDARQAKRLFPLFNASRILGQVIAGLSTDALVKIFHTENLINIWILALVVAFVFIRVLLPKQGTQASPRHAASKRSTPPFTDEIQRAFKYVRTSSLMRWIALGAVFYSALYFSVTLPFQTAVVKKLVEPDSIASFLGLFSGINTAAAFLLSLLLANRIFNRIGIMLSILVLPIIYFLGFGSLTIYTEFYPIIIFRFVQTLWLSGMVDSAYQAMFKVVPPERRDQVRTFINGIPEQVGTILGGIVLFLFSNGQQSTQLLYLIATAAAGVYIFAIWRARQGYNNALVEALQAGQPHLFYEEEQPFGGFNRDATAVSATLKGMTHSDATIRRVAAEILGHLAVPEATPVLIKGLTDSDAHVRATCIRSLAQLNADIAFNNIITALRDPEGDVRVEAIVALTRLTKPASNSSMVLSVLLPPLLDDPDSRVSTRAAVAVLKVPSRSNVKAMLQGNTAPKSGSHARAMQFLRQTAILGDLDARLDAIEALGEWKDIEAVKLLQAEIDDVTAPASIRRAALAAITRADPVQAQPILLATLGDADPAVRNKAAERLGTLGADIRPILLEALNQPNRQDGALAALGHIQDIPEEALETYARTAQARALQYHAMQYAIPKLNPPHLLLIDTLGRAARAEGLRAIQAISLLGDRDALNLAIEELQQHHTEFSVDALETIDALTLRWRAIIQPLMKLWEEEALEPTVEPSAALAELLVDPTPWLRACAAYAARYSVDSALGSQLDEMAASDPDPLVRDAAASGEKNMDTINTLSIMDRILFLKNVPLFDDLSPTDLKQVAFTATEEVFLDGATLAQEGDQGDTMFVIVSGEVRVCVSAGKTTVELARRKQNEYVGEMAIITNAPRSASLIAAGDVRVLSLSQKSFLSLLRDRPEVSLSIIRALSKRLADLNQRIEKLSAQQPISQQ